MRPVITSWQERDQIIDLDTTEDGFQEVLIARSTRKSDQESWSKVKEFKSKQYPEKLVTTIDNRRFVSLMFPISGDATWNGNAFDDLDQAKYYYDLIGEPATVGAQ